MSSEDPIIEEHNASLVAPYPFAAPPDKMARLFAALVKAQGEAENAKADSTAVLHTGKKYQYASLDVVRNIARPCLANNGLALMAMYAHDGIRWLLCHTDGGFLTWTTPYPGGVMPTAHALGSHRTYVDRVQVAGIAGIAVDKDEDGHIAEEDAQATIAAKEQRPASAPTPPTPAADQEAKSARSTFFKVWASQGRDITDKAAMEQFLQEANNAPGLWASKANAEQWRIAIAALEEGGPDPFR